MTVTYLPDQAELPDESPEAMFDLLEARGLGDGLPVVAPTPARVDAMLEHATGDPDEVLFTLQPRSGVLTRRVAAINAVLAGCPPATFPVVLTALRALAQPGGEPARGQRHDASRRADDPRARRRSPRRPDSPAASGVSAPATGPMRRSAGRVRLAMLHVAGAKPGFGDAATHGQPAKYTFCAAENLAESPWGSFARSRGVTAPSAVTVHCGEGPHNVHDAEAAGEPGLILDKIASAMTSLGMNNAPISQGEFFIVLGPEHAASIGAAGHVPRGRLVLPLRPGPDARVRLPSPLRGARLGAVDEDRPDDHLLPMTGEPGNIKVVVAGGPGKHSLVVPSWGMTRSVTLPVEG